MKFTQEEKALISQALDLAVANVSQQVPQLEEEVKVQQRAIISALIALSNKIQSDGE